MTATLFSWDDASAPVLPTSGTGGLRTIMKACLIDGYGTRTAKGGWTIAFDNTTDKIVFKHGIESIYFRVDDSVNYQWAIGNGYVSMTDVDTGTGKFPPDSMLTYNNLIGKRYSSNTDSSRWYMLIDDNGDWFYFFTANPTYPTGFYFGKLSTFDNTSSNWFITGYDATSISSSNFPRALFTNDSAGHFIQNDRYNLGLSEKCQLRESVDDVAQPSPIDGKLVFSNEYVRSSASPYIIYGKPTNRIKSAGPISNIITSTDFITIDSVNYLAITQGTDVFLFSYDSKIG